MNWLLLFGSLFGFMSLVLGASADHLIQFNEDQLTSFETALRYNMLNAAIITFIGLMNFCPLDAVVAQRLRASGWMFCVGALLFSGGIYASLLSGFHPLVYFTPLGGIALMLSWLSLAYIAVSARHFTRS
jgi:uncharacterized membrane protein YgdD (TMEM256/DUF423 family)